ncbi:MAG: hypothetical protein K8F91_22010 [Candidatus Obscuribacterales bacterium]|nr:hypothetical protein [Candidatus Obscuribacterales bacterium]
MTRKDLPNFLMGAYKVQTADGVEEEVAIVYKGDIVNPHDDVDVLIRINSGCFTGDIFHDELCDCTWQMEEAFRMILAHDGPGMLIYFFRHEGKSHGFLEKLRAYKDNMFPVDGDLRDFSPAVAILADLGIKRVTLMTNNPEKIAYLTDNGIEVAGTKPVVIESDNLVDFLDFKARTFGHFLPTKGSGNGQGAKHQANA